MFIYSEMLLNFVIKTKSVINYCKYVMSNDMFFTTKTVLELIWLLLTLSYIEYKLKQELF